MKRGENVFNLGNVMKKINHIISEGAKTIMTDTQFLEKEIKKFKNSPKRMAMITGEKYYLGEHDILQRKRTVIGENGEPLHRLQQAYSLSSWGAAL